MSYKITYNGYYNYQTDSIENAVTHALTPDHYSYEGQLEKLFCQIEKLQEMLARLVEHTYDNSCHSREYKLENILGNNYKVEQND